MLESDASVKKAQPLARHKTPQMTMNVYVRARGERLAKTVENIGETLFAQSACATYVQQGDRSSEGVSRLENNDLPCATAMPKGGFEPARQGLGDPDTSGTDTGQNLTDSKQINTLSS